MMTLREFHNGLRILTSIDFADLVNAGVLTDDADGDSEWEHFRDNPWKWMIHADDDQAEKLWALMVKRGAIKEAA
jgi:hypothetical protein